MKRPITLATIERFMEITSWGPTRFGRESVGDGRLVPNLRNGREMSRGAEPQVAAFIERHVEQEAEKVRKLKALVR